MFASFICKNCNNKIIIDFSDPNKIPGSCSKCGSEFINSHYISSFADTFLSLQRVLHNLEFCGLSSGEINLIYDSDIKILNKLYMHSSPKVKEVLTRILDTNFLMIYHAAKDEDLKSLEKYASSLRTIFEKEISLKNEKMNELLRFSDD